MKTLLHSIVWCPEDQPLRQAGLKKNLDSLLTYQGNYDILITINHKPGPQVQSLLDQFGKDSEYSGKQVKLEYFENNPGWAWARNRAICATLDGNYDLLAMLDGDIWVTDNAWVIKAQKAAEALPVFMCRMNEPQFKTGGKLKFMGQQWDIYDEWLGCINVARRHVLKKVGGYNHIDLPQEWGFHDCEWGRRLRAAGYFDQIGAGYPSMANLNVIEEQEKEYDAYLKKLKDKCLQQYTQKFWQMNNEIINGQRPIYFDPYQGQ